MVFILLPLDHQKKKTPEISGAVLDDEFDENAGWTNHIDEREEVFFFLSRRWTEGRSPYLLRFQFGPLEFWRERRKAFQWRKRATDPFSEHVVYLNKEVPTARQSPRRRCVCVHVVYEFSIEFCDFSTTGNL